MNNLACMWWSVSLACGDLACIEKGWDGGN